MGSPLHKYFRAVRLVVANISNTPELYFQHSGRDFTRRRLLPAERTVWLVLSLLRQSLCVEIGHFFQRLDAPHDLPTGETEVLLTTLTDKKKYPWAEFGNVYRRRWGVESCFFSLKSLLQLARVMRVGERHCWEGNYRHAL